MESFAEIEPRPVSDLIAGIEVIDVDTHYSEPHDLWVSRAPASLRHRVPRVELADAATGLRNWVIDDGIVLGPAACAFSTIMPDGRRSTGTDFLNWTVDDVHPSSWNVRERLKMMDACNIRAQIVYNNVMGFGGDRGAQVDAELRLATIQIYNDAMADMQRESGERLLPMALLPWWDPDLAAAEVKRVAGMRIRGVNINSDPHGHRGLPDLGDPYWHPMWEALQDHELPINFHIGSSSSALDWAGAMPWPSQSEAMRFVVGGTTMFFSNGQVMANIICSGILDRFPTLQFVSVESGIGWIPFVLEALDHQMIEGQGRNPLQLLPSEYFTRNFHGSFWFEKKHLAWSVRAVGVDRVMFETDFPHPTCVYPESADFVLSGLADLSWEERNRILSVNARKLYRI